jgi:hypothetical protein
MTIFYLKRSPIDRRGSEDMREVHSLDYFMDGGGERRKFAERRRSEERRSDWVCVSKWCSVYVGKRKTRYSKSEVGIRNVE